MNAITKARETSDYHRILGIAQTLKQKGIEVNADNIYIGSLFSKGGTITEEDKNCVYAVLDDMEDKARRIYKSKKIPLGNGIEGLGESIYVATYMNRKL